MRDVMSHEFYFSHPSPPAKIQRSSPVAAERFDCSEDWKTPSGGAAAAVPATWRAAAAPQNFTWQHRRTMNLATRCYTNSFLLLVAMASNLRAMASNLASC